MILVSLRSFAPKLSPRTDFFKLGTQKGNDLLMPKRQTNGKQTFWREHDPKNTLNLKKSGFVSE